MCNTTLKPWSWHFKRVFLNRLPRLLTLLGLLLPGAGLRAQTTVTTLGGGQPPGYFGYRDGATLTSALFHTPAGLALDSTGQYLFVADRDNNVIRYLDLMAGQTWTLAVTYTNLINKPIAVAVDPYANVYVLNRGNGANGSVYTFDCNIYSDTYGEVITNAVQLTNAAGMSLDSADNIYVTVQSNKLIRIDAYSSSQTTIATIANAGTSLQGIVVKHNGLIAACDSGRNGIYLIDPATGVVTTNAGFHGQGDFTTNGNNVAASSMAKFNQPMCVAEAGDGTLIVSDYGNNRVKAVLTSGVVTNLYGVTAQFWGGSYPGWYDGDVKIPDSIAPNAQSRLPFGVVMAPDGSIYTSEDYYHVIRKVTGTGLSGLKPGYPSRFNNPAGIALNNENTELFIADATLNTISQLNLVNNQTTVFLNSSNGIYQPVDVALDSSDNLYVLNQGTGGNGSIWEFDRFGNLLATNAIGLALPTAMTRDAAGNILVSEQNGVVQSFNAGVSNTVATIANAGVQLKGIALFSDGTVVVSDEGNDVIWQINPFTHAVSLFTGQLNSPGSTLGSPAFAKLNQPRKIVLAGAGSDDVLVAADSGNNRLVVIGRDGSVTNVLNSTNASVWFGEPGDPVAANSPQFVPMLSPDGIAVKNGGTVFTSETIYDDVRGLTGTGLSLPVTVNGGGPGATNIVVTPPTITPNSGYYPMGQTIAVQSASPYVYYTTDGSEPTTSSLPVAMTNNIGFIHWFNSTNDLTGLRVKTFVGTNASVTVSGQPVSASIIGTPPGFNSTPTDTNIYAGIGSSIVVPIVCDLNSNSQVKSFQLRYEIAPLNNPHAPVILPLNISPTNDFVPVVTAVQGGIAGAYSVTPYTLGPTNGFAVFAYSNIFFQHFAVVGMIEVQIPPNANPGDQYALNVSFPSATADGYNQNVPLKPMVPAIITVSNLPYTVGDSASGNGAWYNAGGFGDGNLDNADVMQAFFAASGLRVPYSFSDVFYAMDVYPVDTLGSPGGDGQIRFLDWNTILARALRLDDSNWSREWSVGGNLIDFSTNLVASPAVKAGALSKSVPTSWPWYRQALVGGVSVGNVVPGAIVNVPVYVKLQYGSALGGLQFRALVTPQDGAPPLSSSPQFNPADGAAGPLLQQSFKAGEAAFGWPLVPAPSLSYSSDSSNFLGWVSFTVPATAQAGQVYRVAFANADGAPDLNTSYDLESRSACVTVSGPAIPASICSDEWKIHFFGSLTNPLAGDDANPTGNGLPNWMAFQAGTDPTASASRFQFSGAGKQIVNGKPQVNLHWLTAPGKAYAVQWSTDLTAGPWNTLTTVAGDGTQATCVDTNTGGLQRYYRLYLLP